MLPFEAVMALNFGKKILMLSTKYLVKPTNTTLGTVILEHTHKQTNKQNIVATQITWNITLTS
jgi:hypothetical protein